MNPHRYIDLILKEFPDLSPETRSALELLMKQLLIADRRSKLGELHLQLAIAHASQACRTLLDTVMLDNADLLGAPSWTNAACSCH